MSSPFHFRLVVGALFALCSLPGSTAWPQATGVRSAPLVNAGAAVEIRPRSAPPFLQSSKASAAPLADLGAAREVAAAELEAIKLWNRSGRKPARNGFSRVLPEPRTVELGSSLWSRASGSHAGGLFEKQADGALAWTAAVRVQGAVRTRLHLAEVELPAAALLWVSGENETVGPFGLELRDETGGLWTPSVAGETARLTVRIPAPTAAGPVPRFVIDQTLELLGEASSTSGEPGPGLEEKAGECLVNTHCVDSTTFDVVDLVQRAVAHLQFVDSCPAGIPGNCSYVCSGGLINDGPNEEHEIPYLLTANHCFGRQRAAASLEAFFDFVSTSCANQSTPPLSSLPRASGSTLMVSSAETDVTLVRLNSRPANRILLGWTTAPVPDDTVLHRISNPCDPNQPSGCSALPQRYSRNHVDEQAPSCQGVDRPDFIYESYFQNRGDMGATFGGSSGAPVMIDGGRVVGQLLGGCGTNPQDGCDYDANADVDGAFSASFALLAKFLDPGAGTCVEDGFTACLVGGRFQVTLDFRTQQGLEARAQVAAAGTDNSGLFFYTNPSNWEMLVKVLDGCPVNGRKWLFYAATTNVDFTLTVVDTQTGQFKVYGNPLGQAAAPVQDTEAFATCP